MMNNLFSIFDPTTSELLSLNWLSSIYVFIFFPFMYWFIPSRWNYMYVKLFGLLNGEFKTLLYNKKIKLINLLFFIGLFILILDNNFLGLFPYIFTATSHLSMTLTLALVLWLANMMFNLIKNFNNTMSHMVPKGTPWYLMFFMVVVETFSNLIRPMTLCIRLTANMVAGHLLLSLMSGMFEFASLYNCWFMMFAECMLLILEISVSLIQAYVFTVLVVLYNAEV
uniref:ATP synthase F0 subunit 6 n=1 Tax=Cheiloneurus elegans TaxID=1107371 RepID=UPI00233ED5E7|nr:ATP synthase F0 subunit 6 [Cheiloneurus elegans]WBR65746.1 ATP synthase F0 subunit 6 [Cheiloneurus elegans]